MTEKLKELLILFFVACFASAALTNSYGFGLFVNWLLG